MRDHHHYSAIGLTLYRGEVTKIRYFYIATKACRVDTFSFFLSYVAIFHHRHYQLIAIDFPVSQ